MRKGTEALGTKLCGREPPISTMVAAASHSFSSRVKILAISSGRPGRHSASLWAIALARRRLLSARFAKLSMAGTIQFTVKAACPKTIEAFAAKLHEISSRPPGADHHENVDEERLVAEDVEMISPRLMDALPVLVVPDLLGRLKEHGDLGLETYDHPGNAQRLSELTEAVNDALQGRSLAELVRDTHAALETKSFDQDPHLRRICVLIYGIAANSAATAAQDSSSQRPSDSLRATSRELTAAARELAYEAFSKSQS